MNHFECISNTELVRIDKENNYANGKEPFIRRESCNGYGDLSTHTKNMIFVDGKVHKTNKIEFHTKDKKCGEAWPFTSDDKRINLRLEPITDSSGRFNVGFGKADINQIHGLYYSSLVLDDGREIKLDGIHGHIGDISYLW